MSAELIGTALKTALPESFVDWDRRRTFDKVILYDWTSTYDNQSPILSSVFDALTKVYNYFRYGTPISNSTVNPCIAN